MKETRTINYANKNPEFKKFIAGNTINLETPYDYYVYYKEAPNSNILLKRIESSNVFSISRNTFCKGKIVCYISPSGGFYGVTIDVDSAEAITVNNPINTKGNFKRVYRLNRRKNLWIEDKAETEYKGKAV